MKKNYVITIGWLYPELMSTYGDRGNILVLQKRCAWRGIQTEIINIDQKTSTQQIQSVDLLFGGGAQDREQEIVMQDLQKKKSAITTLIKNNIPALFVCGAPQLMGNYYEPAEGKRIEGLGIFDMFTKHPGKKQQRLIGNVVAKIYPNVIASDEGVRQSYNQPEKIASSFAPRNDVMVGFENHGGRTYLAKNTKPLATIVKGFGNNGEDGTEGVVFNNAIGTYLHGPLLPKNPHIADWLIAKALEVKYKKPVKLEKLDDSLEEKAKEVIQSLNG